MCPIWATLYNAVLDFLAPIRTAEKTRIDPIKHSACLFMPGMCVGKRELEIWTFCGGLFGTGTSPPVPPLEPRTLSSVSGLSWPCSCLLAKTF